MDFIAEDLSVLIHHGEQVVVVHGASATRDEVAQKLGIPTRTIISPSGVSSVYTDDDAIDVFLMTYAGLVNKRIVVTLQKHGINAMGLSGVDGRLWEAQRKDVIYAAEGGKVRLITGNLTGKVEKVNNALLKLLLDNSYVPVVCPPAISFDNQIVNTDNDFATAVMIEALGIKEMVVLFEAPGMLKDVHDDTSIIPEIEKEKISSYLEFAAGRMKKKLLGSQKAFERGVQKIYWGDGRIEHPVLNAIAGKGTVIQ